MEIYNIKEKLNFSENREIFSDIMSENLFSLCENNENIFISEEMKKEFHSLGMEFFMTPLENDEYENNIKMFPEEGASWYYKKDNRLESGKFYSHLKKSFYDQESMVKLLQENGCPVTGRMVSELTIKKIGADNSYFPTVNIPLEERKNFRDNVVPKIGFIIGTPLTMAEYYLKEDI